MIKKSKKCKKILVVKPSSLGDIVHSLPFLNSLKTCFPKAEIHWVIAKGLEGLLECHPMVDRLIIINKDIWKKLSRMTDTIKEVRQLLKDIRSERYDLAVDLQGLFRSGVITLATRAPVRIGFSEAREGSRFFYNVKVKGGKDVHAVQRYMKIAGALGCDTEEILFPFPLCRSEMKNMEDIRSCIKEYAVIVPGARWDTKIWDAGNFGRLASFLPIQSVVIGGKADMAIAEKVVQASSGKALSLAGKTGLKELIEVMRHARLVISNDSGPMHIAAGFQVPVVAIFGPTSPVRTGPYGAGNIVIQSDAACAPCFKKKCGDMRCMTGISVEMVYEKMRNISCGLRKTDL
ncbi:MAG: lipopolysaccharide heptosyltransferase II [Nitrospira bacterium HGW-Nitrospira-1]|nr:MAG: lipopolysaccharide heptosyltransferase II [Nitrospira bacterium HGW-Nitrospira-1]